MVYIRKLDLGDLYIVDSEELGIDIYAKARKGKKDRRVCFINLKGCEKLEEFLMKKRKDIK